MKYFRSRRSRACASLLVLGPSWGAAWQAHSAADVEIEAGTFSNRSDVDTVVACRLSQALRRHPNADTFRLRWTQHDAPRGPLQCQASYSRRSMILREQRAYSGQQTSLWRQGQMTFANTSEKAIHIVASRDWSLSNVNLFGATSEFVPGLLDRPEAWLQEQLR